ncbi:MAG: PilN domain-containing protein [Prosthecobacter sp.]
MSFRRTSQQILSFPGEEAREFWQCQADGSCQPAETGPCTVFGVESIAFDSAPFWFLSQDDGPEDAVALRWEGFGLEQEPGAHLWTHWVVTRKEKHLLVATLAFAPDAAAQGREGMAAERFEVSAQLLPLPIDGIAVWRELGRYVAAFTRGAQLLHLTVLAARRLDADAAFEIRDTYAALQAHEHAGTVATVRVWTACEADFAPQLACLFEDASVLKEKRPDPRLPANASGLLPAQVAQGRRQLQAMQRKMVMLATVALVYVCFFGAWWVHLQLRESKIDTASAQVAAQQPEIETIREAQANWLEMEGAIDPDLYPLEIYHQVVSLLPPEGIRLKEFQIDNGKVVIAGEATSVNHATSFKDKLLACQPLQRYAWNFPVPSIREDNRADFRTTGIVQGQGEGGAQ